ncbi:helix-turn-helix domain-containing protein [Lentzea albida]|uniref:DNA binding domain-containing protein, excisionase family n=1 Tax=Lentzea albida TaxID=65499 RepID=A0A1H9VIS1_9PSEU|nr:helix-turn-helix domain-containing protein [Lentzea albida]SES21157.1 DNA binding domain-containing protein, excisionase family [Lentzea albida]
MAINLLGIVTELCKRDPRPEAITASILGDLSSDEQREQAYAGFTELVRLTLDGSRRRGLSVVEVAATLGVSDEQVYALVAKGEIGHVRIGKLIRIPDHELERFLRTAGVGA